MADADAVIQTAALEVIAEVGFDRATIDLIAARSGVGRATVYRRYPSKEAVLVAALQQVRLDAPEPGGDPLSDFVDALMSISISPLEPRLVAALSGRATESPELLELLRRARIEPHRAVLAGIIRNAVEQDRLPAGTDGDLIIELAVGFVAWRSLARPDTPLDREAIEDAVRLLWRNAR